jgi:3-hydroxyacyl-[acyl-carrier-protein] dehydratase
MKFDLIDQILDTQPDALTAVKNVTVGEDYMADHFPGYPVLPGVMMIETMVQAARRLLEQRHGMGPGDPVVLKQVRNIRYGNMVRPGEQLRVTITLRKHDADENLWEFQGVGTVDDEVAVQGRFELERLQV